MLEITTSRVVHVRTNEGFFLDVAAKKFREVAARMVRERIQKNEGRKFQILVDGRLASSPQDIYTATRRVRLDFISTILERAILQVSEMQAKLMQAINARTQNTNVWSWVERQEPFVVVLYAKDGESKLRDITGQPRIEDFEPGDRLLIVPDMTTQMYLNTITQTIVLRGREFKMPTGGGGFMRMASAAIRRSAGILKKQSVISVAAIRSRGVYEHLIANYSLPVRKRDGQEFTPAPHGKGQRGGNTYSWAIQIKFRKIARTYG